MKKAYILLFSILALVFSCGEKGKNNTSISHYEKEGISFNLPKGWGVKQDYSNENGRYLELNKYTNRVSNTMAIGLLNKKQPSDSVIAHQIEQLEDFYQKNNFKFKISENNKKTKLGKYDVLMTSYEADDAQNKAYGKICVFDEGEKTIYVQIVGYNPNEDMSDYNIIFGSFISN